MFFVTCEVVDGRFRFVLVVVVVVVDLSGASRRCRGVVDCRTRRRVALRGLGDVITSCGNDVSGVEVGAAAEPVAGRQSELVAGDEETLADGAPETVDMVDEIDGAHDEVAALERHRTHRALGREPTANSHRPPATNDTIRVFFKDLPEPTRPTAPRRLLSLFLFIYLFIYLFINVKCQPDIQLHKNDTAIHKF